MSIDARYHEQVRMLVELVIVEVLSCLSSGSEFHTQRRRAN